MQYKINKGKTTQPLNIKYAETSKNATYVGDFSILDKKGQWTNQAVAVFYQENPAEGHSHYFGLYYDRIADAFCICNAESAFSKPITAIVGSDGEVLYSRYGHDFRSLADGSGAIDGGRDYCRIIGGPNGAPLPRIVTLKIQGSSLVVVEDEGKELEAPSSDAA